MSSPLGSKQNVKVFVLYLMQNVGYPMDFVTINDIIMQTDYVAYLDFAESFAALEDAELILREGENQKGEPTFVVSDKGRTVVESLRDTILPSILDESLACALRYLDFTRRGVKTSCRTEKSSAGGYDFTCTITEKGNTLLSVTLHADSAAQAARMEAQFRAAPENMFRGTLALLSGNVNYLFS